MTQPKTPRRRLAPALRLRILERDSHTCVYCGLPASVVDHVRPVCREGTDDPENLVAACTSCNAKASGLYFKTFALKKTFILDPTTKTPSVMTMRQRKRIHKNHPWRKPINSKKLPPSGSFG